MYGLESFKNVNFNCCIFFRWQSGSGNIAEKSPLEFLSYKNKFSNLLAHIKCLLCSTLLHHFECKVFKKDKPKNTGAWKVKLFGIF